MFDKLFKKEIPELVKEDLVEEVEQKLTDKEMATMDIRNEKKKTFRFMKNLIKTRKELVNKEKEVYEAKLQACELKLKLLESDEVSIDKKELESAKKHKAFVTELKKRLKIKSERWGFNPDTGVIIE